VSFRRWTPGRTLALLLITLVWLATGVGTYMFLSAQRGSLANRAKQPGQEQTNNGPLQRLPGTLYLVQGGTLYKLQHGTFTPLLRGDGSGTWTQPAVSPSGQSLVVVKRAYAYSDLYLVDASGHVQSQLTRDASKTVELNHWAMYPRFAADGTTLFFSYDPKDRNSSYNVVLAVWSVPLGASIAQMRKWTLPQGYTGGDVQPVPLATGGALYTKYTLDTAANRILAQIYVVTRIGTIGRALTPPADDCSQPALSPDGKRLAMICTGGTQVSNVQVASFNGSAIGPRVTVVAGQMAAQPTWAPDGQGLVYLAAQGVSGHFQLWQQQVPATPPVPSPSAAPVAARAAASRAARTPTPSPTASTSPSLTPTPLPAPVQLTNNLDFDATSTIAWHA
jgi:WD40-like Beta Propeller Repeat